MIANDAPRIFMSEQQVDELTGILRGRCGKSKHDMQCEWIKRQGIPFYINARGRPVVPLSALEGKREKVPTTWSPNFSV